jgi:hypothetical protein
MIPIFILTVMLVAVAILLWCFRSFSLLRTQMLRGVNEKPEFFKRASEVILKGLDNENQKIQDEDPMLHRHPGNVLVGSDTWTSLCPDRYARPNTLI